MPQGAFVCICMQQTNKSKHLVPSSESGSPSGCCCPVPWQTEDEQISPQSCTCSISTCQSISLGCSLVHLQQRHHPLNNHCHYIRPLGHQCHPPKHFPRFLFHPFISVARSCITHDSIKLICTSENTSIQGCVAISLCCSFFCVIERQGRQTDHMPQGIPLGARNKRKDE